MRRLSVLLLAGVLLLSACSDQAEPQAPGEYNLYYAALLDGGDGGDAIRTERFHVENGDALDTAALAEQLVQGLLSTPEDPGLYSPFPGGTSLLKLGVAGGRASVDLSLHYARLSGVDLSIADACVTLTLTQLPGIYAVRITADGRELPYRKTQLLTAADALISGKEDVIRPIDVSLYFLDRESGSLRAQQQTLGLYEGQTRIHAVLEALKRGPAGDDALLRILPDSFSVLSSRIESGIYYVNLSGSSLLEIAEELRPLAVESLSRSLLSLNGVAEVQVLVDGELMWTVSIPVSAEAPIEENE